MILFKPDNFSVSEINFKTTNFNGDLNKILGLYFDDYEINNVSQLDRREINSENYKIELKAGGVVKFFLLRKHLHVDTPKRTGFYLGLLVELNGLGVPVNRVVPSLSGETLVAVADGVFSLFEFIDGAYFSPEEELFASVAKAIAQMHAAFNLLDSHYFDEIGELSKETKAYYNKITEYSKEDFEEIRRLIENKQIKTDVDLMILENCHQFIGVVDEVDNFKDAVGALPKQVIHSDLHPHNFLFKHGEVRAILDFDAVRISEQARDVAFAVYRFGRQFLINRDMVEVRRLAPALKDNFLKSYAGIKPISMSEARLMPILLKDEFTRKLLFVLKGVYLENNHTWSNDLPKFMAAMEEINYFWP